MALLLEWLANRTLAQVIINGLLAAAVVELLTCFLRFGLGLRGARDTAWFARFTFGWRVHHGYFGVLALGLAYLAPAGAWRRLLTIVAVALVVSDLAHHFLVLWPITGSPQFDLRYPDR